jgi:predicted AAA+ superfamily ATPase
MLPKENPLAHYEKPKAEIDKQNRKKFVIFFVYHASLAFWRFGRVFHESQRDKGENQKYYQSAGKLARYVHTLVKAERFAVLLVFYVAADERIFRGASDGLAHSLHTSKQADSRVAVRVSQKRF